MSRIDELIAELCPDGVEFVELGKLLAYEQPTKYLVDSTAYSDSYATPVLTAGQTFVLGRTDETNGIYPASTATPVIIFDDFTTAFKWVDFPFKVKSSAMKMLTPKDAGRASLRYIYYVMQTIRYEPQDHARQWIGIYSGFQVPVPPLEVQREIVRVLDQFTQLEAELEAELEARRRQYSYYRDELLISSVDAQRTPLGEIGDFRYGFTASAQDSGDCRFIRITDISPWGKLNPAGAKYVESSVASDEYLVERGDLLMARTGATYGKTMIVESDEPAVYASFLIRIRPDPEVLNPSFYWHFAQSTLYWDQVNAMVSTGGQPQFNANVLKLVKVPLPSLDEQQRVVAVLDRFDALVNDLSVGLPAELAARRKQYEYYRDKLLTFKELAA